MRIDANNDRGYLYQVWDCNVCRFLENVTWVDDELNKYSVIAGFSNNEACYKTIKAKILIIPEIKLIYINPKETKQQLLIDLTTMIMERVNQ